jgi:hypothetical protein
MAAPPEARHLNMLAGGASSSLDFPPFLAYHSHQRRVTYVMRLRNWKKLRKMLRAFHQGRNSTRDG